MTEESLERDPSHGPVRRTCCPCCEPDSSSEVTRRSFLQGAGGATLVGAALTGLTWSAVAMAEANNETAPERRAIVVKPVLVYDIP